ncbi:MAG: O-succinylhomoserine sulfhydrylase [Aestuariivita sp.]|nr:O-succinylhomoserine sulfhydrylase [Aestuariivita sp.]
MDQNWKPRTRAVHGGSRRSQYGELSEAIFLTQGFVYDTAESAEARFIKANSDEFIYARYGNPTIAMFEDRIAGIEGAEDAFATASGMAAVSASLLAMLRQGDHVLSARALFSSCLFVLEEILPRFGISVTFVDGTSLDQWKQAIQPNTKAVFLETISNPTLEVIDLEEVAKIAHQVDAKVIVDNVFSTPVFSKALALGVDIVIYSSTKHIDGQGRALGGIILSNQEFIRTIIEPYMKHTGGSMSPFTAWIMLKSLETLDLRVHAQANSAQKMAEVLYGQQKLKRVIYPGHISHDQFDLVMKQIGSGGTVLSIDFSDGQGAAFRFLNSLKVAKISNNLGDAKTIATHPATTTHQRLSKDRKDELGITPGLVRISIGLEDSEDLIDDVLQAVKKA